MHHSCIMQMSIEFTVHVVSGMGGVAVDFEGGFSFSSRNNENNRQPGGSPLTKFLWANATMINVSNFLRERHRT